MDSPIDTLPEVWSGLNTVDWQLWFLPLCRPMAPGPPYPSNLIFTQPFGTKDKEGEAEVKSYCGALAGSITGTTIFWTETQTHCSYISIFQGIPHGPIFLFYWFIVPHKETRNGNKYSTNIQGTIIHDLYLCLSLRGNKALTNRKFCVYWMFQEKIKQFDTKLIIFLKQHVQKWFILFIPQQCVSSNDCLFINEQYIMLFISFTVIFNVVQGPREIKSKTEDTACHVTKKP